VSLLITISGLPGSGTSTLCGHLIELSGRPYVNAGRIFRDLASERNLSLADFGILAEENDEIDRCLDARMVEFAGQQPGAVLEGRVTGWMAHRHQLQAFKVWIAADIHIRASRVGGRDEQSQQDPIDAVREREKSEHSRYSDYYGIDLEDMSIYDLVLNSEQIDAEQLAQQIHDAVRTVHSSNFLGEAPHDS
jgi:predicted cytidylate kinase